MAWQLFVRSYNHGMPARYSQIQNRFYLSNETVFLNKSLIITHNLYYLVDGNHLSTSVLQTEDEFMIEDNGELIIGQDQDCLLGCFDEPQALTGDLEDFTIWDTALRSVFIFKNKILNFKWFFRRVS